MESILLVWTGFAAALVVIAYAGSRLSRYGDIIAEKAGLSKGWVGLVLLATVTSLPELVTGVTAVVGAESPDLAIGNILGACVFNLGLLVVLDVLHRSESMYTRAGQGHILAAGFGVILIGLTGVSITLAGQGISPAIFHVGAYAPIILALYFIAMRIVFSFERQQLGEAVEERAERYPEITLKQAISRYALFGAAVVGAGMSLPFLGARIAELMDWSQTFVGTLFIAFATTLPEMVVTVSALRIGALDLAIGNLLGSNIFNIAIIALDDLVYTPGPVLAAASPMHVFTALSALMMNGIVVVGLLYRPRTKLMRFVGWVSLALLAVYLMNFFVLYLHRVVQPA